MKLNLKDWKKMSSDDNHTVLANNDGHTLKIMHRALSPKLMQQLGELSAEADAKGGKVSNPKLSESKKQPPKSATYADGGNVSDSPPEAPSKNAKAMQEGATSSGVPSAGDVVKNLKEGLGLAKGGKVPDPTQRHLLAGDRIPNSIEKGVVKQAKKGLGLADGGPSSSDIYGGGVPDPTDSDDAPATPASFISPDPNAQAAQANQAQENIATNGLQNVTPAEANQIKDQGPLDIEPVGDDSAQADPQQAAPNFLHAYNSQMQGLEQEAQAQSQLGQAQAGTLQNQAISQKNALDHYQQAYQDLDQENKNFMDDVAAGHIDPKKFLGDMSTLQKAKTAVGLILGGIGGGLTHQENPALKFLNAQIDRDIQAQQANLSNKQTLLSANLHRFGNLRDATDMTRLMMNGMMQTELQGQAAKAATPMAQANLLKAKGAIEAQQAPMFQQMAMRQALMQGGAQGADPSSFVPFVVPAEHQKAVFSEIERAQNTQHMGDSIVQAFDQAAKDNTVMKTGAGMLRTPPSVMALHQAMQPTFQDLEGTVRQAAMDNTFHNITPQPGDMGSTIATKRAALQQYLQSKMSAPTAKAYGIDLQRFGNTTQDPYQRLNPQQQQFADWAKANQSNPKNAQRADLVLKKLGLH